jgi:nucleosome binding factor SPN SPT16 subunit
MSLRELDSQQFMSRAKKIRSHLGQPLLIMLGRVEDVEQFGLNSALFLYLLNYEFPETILVVDDVCTAITSRKKAEILSQIRGIRTIVRNKDNSNIHEVYAALKMSYLVVDRENMQGEFCQDILSRIKHEDATHKVIEMLLVKEDDEISRAGLAARAASHVVRRGVEMLWRHELTQSGIEQALSEKIEGVDGALLEFSFPTEFTSEKIRVGVRYDGYCAEAARTIILGMEEEYVAQDYILGLIRPGVNSKYVYDEAASYFRRNDMDFGRDFLYTTGLLSEERSFEDSFTLRQGNVFVLNLSDENCSLSNTFVLGDVPEYLTEKDSASDFTETRPRLRNKSKDYELVVKIKEHQKQLLEKLIEEQLEHYRDAQLTEEEKEGEDVVPVPYAKESQIPRHGKLFVDYAKDAVLVPLGSYIVPFHISCIKNATVTEEVNLRINFKAGKKESGDGEESKVGALSYIKSASIRTASAREDLEAINALKKSYTNKMDSDIVAQEELRQKQRPYALTDVFMRIDVKTGGRKKRAGNLELHENGLRFSEENVDILFSNIKHVFFSEGDIERRTILHFHLNNPVIIGKKTKNIQFYQEAGVNATYDTMRRGNEHMEYILEKEEQERQRVLNSQFRAFVERIEKETPIKVQVPKDGFMGVPHREATMIRQTHECLVSLDEPPFFVLTLEDVEVVNFERVLFTVKTSDAVFVMKNKAQPPVGILSIDAQRLPRFKEYLDSHNILFMETTVNINWNNLIKTIMRDPVSFYENGAWSELMMAESDEESEQESEVSEESTVSEEEDISTSDETVSDVSSESLSEVSEEEISEESEYYSEESDGYDKRKRKRHK